jgi:hypothetical protein
MTRYALFNTQKAAVMPPLHRGLKTPLFFAKTALGV